MLLLSDSPCLWIRSRHPLLSPPYSLHSLHFSDCSYPIRRWTGSGRVVSCARWRMRLDKPAKLSPWNALTDMECLLTYNKADVFFCNSDNPRELNCVPQTLAWRFFCLLTVIRYNTFLEPCRSSRDHTFQIYFLYTQ